jgi:hypothetical protein
MLFDTFFIYYFLLVYTSSLKVPVCINRHFEVQKSNMSDYSNMMEEKHILTRQTVLLRWYIFKLRHTKYSFDRFRFVSVVKRHWPPSYSQLTDNSLHIKVLFLNSIWHRIYNDGFTYSGQKGKNKQKMHYLH